MKPIEGAGQRFKLPSVEVKNAYALVGGCIEVAAIHLHYGLNAVLVGHVLPVIAAMEGVAVVAKESAFGAKPQHATTVLQQRLHEVGIVGQRKVAKSPGVGCGKRWQRLGRGIAGEGADDGCCYEE